MKPRVPLLRLGAALLTLAVLIVLNRLVVGLPSSAVTTSYQAIELAAMSSPDRPLIQWPRDSAQTTADSAWLATLDRLIELALANAGNVDRVATICVARRVATAFAPAPPGLLEQVRTQTPRVRDARSCVFTKADYVAYRSFGPFMRRAWLAWVGPPQPVDSLTFELEAGYWAAPLHGASWRCTVTLEFDSVAVKECRIDWVS